MLPAVVLLDNRKPLVFSLRWLAGSGRPVFGVPGAREGVCRSITFRLWHIVVGTWGAGRLVKGHRGPFVVGCVLFVRLCVCVSHNHFVLSSIRSLGPLVGRWRSNPASFPRCCLRAPSAARCLRAPSAASFCGVRPRPLPRRRHLPRRQTPTLRTRRRHLPRRQMPTSQRPR